MFGQTLIGADYTAYFNFDSFLGTTVCLGLILLAALVVAVAVTWFVGRDMMRPVVTVCVGLMLLYAVAVAVANIVKDFKEGETYTEDYQAVLIAIVVILVVGIAILFALIDRKQHTGRAHTMSVVYAAVCIALAFGLSYVKMYDAPYGGSVTLFSLLPIALYSYMFGIRKGVLCGLVYGMLNSVQDPWIVNPLQFILDYPLAFTMVGLCGGLFRKVFDRLKAIPDVVRDGNALSLGILCGVTLRYFCHVVSGAVYFGEYAADYGFGNEWTYSFVYNALYVFPDGAICVLGAFILMASKYMRNQMYKVIGDYERGVTHAAAEKFSTVEERLEEGDEVEESLEKNERPQETVIEVNDVQKVAHDPDPVSDEKDGKPNGGEKA